MFLPPQGFGPEAKTRRHDRTPCVEIVRKRNGSVCQKKYRLRVISASKGSLGLPTSPRRICGTARKPEGVPKRILVPGSFLVSFLSLESRQTSLSQLIALNGTYLCTELRKKYAKNACFVGYFSPCC